MNQFLWAYIGICVIGFAAALVTIPALIIESWWRRRHEDQ